MTRHFRHLKDHIVDLIHNFLYIPRGMLDGPGTDELADNVIEMCQKLISVDDRLPDDGTWVLAHYNGDTWGEDKGQYWVVAKFIRGLSAKVREALPYHDTRKLAYFAEDEHGNNQRPFYWNQYGAGFLFGQNVDYWMALPTTPKKGDDDDSQVQSD